MLDAEITKLLGTSRGADAQPGVLPQPGEAAGLRAYRPGHTAPDVIAPVVLDSVFSNQAFAGYLPARRASRMDLIAALRYE